MMQKSKGGCQERQENPPVPLRSTATLAVVVAVLLVGIAHFANLSDWMRAPDAWTYDWRTAHFASRPKALRTDITVVTIDETSLDRYPSLSPVDRMLQAKLISALEAAGAKSIGLDFLYDRPTSPEADRALLTALKNAKIPIVIGAVDFRSVLRDRDPLKALAYQEQFIDEAGQPAGHLYFFNAEHQGRFMLGDQVIRHRMQASPHKPYRTGIAEALADAVKVRKTAPTVKPELIDWQRPPASGLENSPVPVLAVTAHEPGASIDSILAEGWEHYVRNRIVLVGGAFGDRDRHLTPLSVSDRKPMPGVLIHAQILAQLMDGREVKTLPIWLESMLVFASVLLGWLIGRQGWKIWRVMYRPEAGGLIENLLAGTAVFLLGVLVFALSGVIFPSATIFIGFMAGLLLGNPTQIVTATLDRVISIGRRIKFT